MQLSSHLDLLFVGIVVASMGLLGFVIVFNNARSTTNRSFFYFAIISIFWSIVNYSYYQFPNGNFAFLLLRGVIFFATWHAFTFFHLTSAFPDDNYHQPWWHTYILIPITGVVSVLTLTPYVFERVTSVGTGNEIIAVQTGPAVAFFGTLVSLLVIFAILKLIRKTIQAPKKQRQAYSMMLTGTIITFVLLLIFNLFIPVIFNNSSFIPLGAIFLLPFVVATSYAIYRHHLFNLKVVTTAFLGFMVTVFTFINVLYSTSVSEIVINITAFAVVLIGSVRIVQDTLNLEKLAEELKEINERQEGLIHFIGHEVKGFLTKDTGAFAALSEGDLGALPDALRPFVDRALAQSRENLVAVTDILKASNQKKGTTEYKKEPFDLAQLAAEEVEKARSSAEEKGLDLSFVTDGSDASFVFVGDKGEIGDHVFRNLIDNAINYTPSGSIVVSLKRESGNFVFAVKDTGVGITGEDKKRLFTEGGHGRNSQRVNTHSTGYGLFIAKNIVIAHGGTIYAESEGEGKGSTFVVTLPIPAGK